MTSSNTAGSVSADPTTTQAIPVFTRPPRDVWVDLGLGIAAASAAFSSFDGLRNLAEAAHWSPYMSPLFALGIDAYALAAIRVWTSRSTSPSAVTFARKNAVGAVVLSLSGNAVYHLIAAGLLEVGWPVVLGVGSVPPVILGLVTHLSILRKQDDRPAREDEAPVLETAPEQEAPVPVRPVQMDEDELLDAALRADNEFRQRYGQGITRDLLRTTLGVGGQKATELLRAIRAVEPPATQRERKSSADP